MVFLDAGQDALCYVYHFVDVRHVPRDLVQVLVVEAVKGAPQLKVAEKVASLPDGHVVELGDFFHHAGIHPERIAHLAGVDVSQDRIPIKMRKLGVVKEDDVGAVVGSMPSRYGVELDPVVLKILDFVYDVENLADSLDHEPHPRD